MKYLSLLLFVVVSLLLLQPLTACDRPGGVSGEVSATAQQITNINNVIGGGGSSGDGQFDGSLDLYGKRGRLKASATGRAAFQISNRGKKPFKRLKK